MENASKALLMAGGILIAVLTIALVIQVFSSISHNYKAQDDIEAVEQITAFNKEYESYNRKLLRGTDIISVCNKAISNNNKYSDVPENQITIKFKMEETLVYHKVKTQDGKTKIESYENKFFKDTEYAMDNYAEITGDKEAFQDFKRRVFDCINVTYREDNGRIQSMTFKERIIDYTEGL